MIYVQLPRFLFLTMSSYIIYQITLAQNKNKAMKSMVVSHRQEEIDGQLRHIEQVLNAEQNHFEPGKNVEYNAEYSGDQFEYQF